MGCTVERSVFSLVWVRLFRSQHWSGIVKFELCCSVGRLGVSVGLGTPFLFSALLWYCKVWVVLLGWRVIFKTFGIALYGFGSKSGQHNNQVNLTPGGAGYLSVRQLRHCVNDIVFKVNMEIAENRYVKLTALSYVFGLLIHNVYLSQFGNYEFELIDAKYVLTGGVFLGFIFACIMYLALGVNTSSLHSMYKIEKLLPWMAKAFSLPVALYVLFYGNEQFRGMVNNISDGNIFLGISMLSYAVIFVALVDPPTRLTRESSLDSRLVRSFLRVIAFPLVFCVVFFSMIDEAFKKMSYLSLFFFIGCIGYALRQYDNKHGFEPKILDDEADDDHKVFFDKAFGFTGLIFTLGFLIYMYTDVVYTRLPVALGGAQPVGVEMTAKNDVFDAQLIQESNGWYLIRRAGSPYVEKIKSSDVHRIVYKGSGLTNASKMTPGGAL